MIFFQDSVRQILLGIQMPKNTNKYQDLKNPSSTSHSFW